MKQSIRTDQRGFGHFMVAFLIIAIVAAVGIIGYRVFHKEDSPADKTVKAKQTTDYANCVKFYHDKTLCTFASENAELSNLAYTAVDNSVNAQSQTSKITVKNDGKGNTSIDSQAGNQSYDSIIIGNTLYVNSDNSGWIKYGANAANAPNATNPTVTLKLDFSDSNTPKDEQIKYKKQGEEKCGNASCARYQVENPKAAGNSSIWINTQTNRLVRWTSKSADGTNDVNVTYGSVTITAPANATDAAAAAGQETQSDAMQAPSY